MRERIFRNGLPASFLLSGLLIAGAAAARAQEDANLHARAARLTFLQGAVTVDMADNTGSQEAQLNLPLLAGVRVATGDDGQAEIEFEDGSLVRLTPNSVLSLDTLSVEDRGDGATGIFTTGLSLLHGLAYVEFRATPQYRYTLDAGGDVLSPVENTTVRVNFDEPPAIFSILDGTSRVARLDGTGYAREVRSGENLRGESGDPSHYDLTGEIAEDSWDMWNEERDQAAAAEAANRTAARDTYAGAQGYGWSDLDANGSWYNVPGQGPVWQPEVAVVDSSFDPYGNGAWVYAGAGYVWASGYSWGWTPYRCGSWSYFSGFGWGWTPASGCGGLRWGFGGGGHPVNILYPPNGYRIPHVPRPHPGPIHPILSTRLKAGIEPPVVDQHIGAKGEPRYIDGLSATRMEPIGRGLTPHHEGVASAALLRDFPVDRASHAAVVGREPAQPGVMHTAAGWQPGGKRPAHDDSGYAGVPAYRRPSGETPALRNSSPTGEGQRPGYASGSTQHGVSPQQPTVPGYIQHSAPAPSSSYSPPVQHSAPAPSYSPPAQHSAPPPPAASSPAPAHASPK